MSGGGWLDPVVGGTVLRTPAIQSPNFSIANETGWAIFQSGLAYFFGLVVAGGSITGPDYVINSSGVFIYSGTPANGNLIVSMAGAAGTDGEGNLYPEGFGVEAGAIPGTLINAGTIGTAELAALAVTAAQIANGTITTAQIAAAAGITAGQVAFSARSIGGITTFTQGTAPSGALADDLWIDTASGNALYQYSGSAWVLFQFGSGSIAANSIAAAQIAANTITASQIAAATITAAQIAAGTITSTQIAAGTITAADLIAGIVVAGIVNATTIEGAQFIAYGTTGEVLIYSGVPAAGNLIGSWSGAAGTDGFANTYPAGLEIGNPSTSAIALLPNVNTPFDITTAISGIFQAAAQMNTSDADQVLPGVLGSLLLGSGAAAKMATALTSPFGTEGAAIVLEAQNDGGTDTPVITFGTITTPDDTTTIFTPIATLSPFAFLLYSGSSGQVTVTKTSGSGTIPIPAGVTTAKGESWGAGNKGAGNSLGPPEGGGGGGAGEYAAEAALVVPGGGTVAYVVPAADSATAATLTGSAVTVTAHGGAAASLGAGGAGGTGSTNTTHNNGGAGGAADSGAGGGGGGSGGTGSAGSAGGTASGSLGGVGGPAVAGGGAGGAGGSSGNSGSSPAAGPGGGGGGAGSGAGAAGQAGQVRLTYSTGAPAILFSMAAVSGTDQFGTAYPAGGQVNGVSLDIGSRTGSHCGIDTNGNIYLNQTAVPVFTPAQAAVYAASGHLKYVGGLAGDGSAYATGRLTMPVPGTTAQLFNSVTPAPITGLSCPVGIGTYRVHGMLVMIGVAAAAGNPEISFTYPAVSPVARLIGKFFPDQGAAVAVNTAVVVASGGVMTGQVLSTTIQQVLEFDGIMTFTAAGTLEMLANCSVAADTFQIYETSSYLEVLPVV